jgi:hypothetical protein
MKPHGFEATRPAQHRLKAIIVLKMPRIAGAALTPSRGTTA